MGTDVTATRPGRLSGWAFTSANYDAVVAVWCPTAGGTLPPRPQWTADDGTAMPSQLVFLLDQDDVDVDRRLRDAQALAHVAAVGCHDPHDQVAIHADWAVMGTYGLTAIEPRGTNLGVIVDPDQLILEVGIAAADLPGPAVPVPAGLLIGPDAIADVADRAVTLHPDRLRHALAVASSPAAQAETSTFTPAVHAALKARLDQLDVADGGPPPQT